MIPVLFLLWFSMALSNILLAPYLGIQFSGHLTEIAYVPILLSYAVSLFAPFALCYDRKYVSERSEWTPNPLYLFVFIPLLNVLISGIYLIKRRRFVGTP